MYQQIKKYIISKIKIYKYLYVLGLEYTSNGIVYEVSSMFVIKLRIIRSTNVALSIELRCFIRMVRGQYIGRQRGRYQRGAATISRDVFPNPLNAKGRHLIFQSNISYGLKIYG